MKNFLGKDFLSIYLSAFLLSFGSLIYTLFTYIVNKIIISKISFKNELLFIISCKLIFLIITISIIIGLYLTLNLLT